MSRLSQSSTRPIRRRLSESRASSGPTEHCAHAFTLGSCAGSRN
jgi:hypothetical protein